MLMLIAIPRFQALSHAADIDEAVERKEWQRALRYHKGDGPVLWIRLPYEELRTTSDSVALSGCTEPGARVTVNGAEVLVYATGAFVGRLPLQYGDNAVEVVSTYRGKSTRKIHMVHRRFPPDPVPVDPPRIAAKRGLLPRGVLELASGDAFTVQFTGSPGGKAWFTIGDTETRHAMQEIPKSSAPYGIPGIYKASYIVQDSDRFDQASIEVHLLLDGVEEKKSTAAQLTTLANKVHSLARTMPDTALNKGQGVSKTLTFLKQSALVEITGRRDDRYRVALPGRDDPAWVKVADIEERMPLQPLETVRVKDIKVSTASDQRSSRILFDLDRSTTHSLPILCDTESNILDLTIWGAHDEGSLTTTKTARVESVSRVRKGPALQYRLRLSDPLWGFDYTFREDGDLELTLRHPPPINPDAQRPLGGVRILLSAGHGGDDTGAVGPAGMRESDANLAITLRLARLLKKAGATIEMVRDDDSYVSLDDRGNIIRESNADFMISIHNNAVSSYTDQRKARGPLAFFTYGHQLELAWNIYNRLPRIRSLDLSPAPVRQRAFRVTRKATHMPGVLVECLFISHPEDEMLLLNPAFLDTLAAEIYKGLVATLSPTDEAEPITVTFATNKYYVQKKFAVENDE
ncbi:MAG: N-acetylmuramoyl-L-alanine amidase [Candidatus Sumerlaeota bacterium]